MPGLQRRRDEKLSAAAMIVCDWRSNKSSQQVLPQVNWSPGQYQTGGDKVFDNWLYWDSHKAQQLAWVLAFALVLQILYVLIVAIVASDHSRIDMGVFILVNGGLTIVKIAVVMALIRALKRNNIVVCYVILAMGVAGIVFVALTFEPDRVIRYLDLETIQYVINVLNLALASLGIILAILAAREIKSLKAKPAEEQKHWKTSA
jgi:hypothetical protein